MWVLFHWDHSSHKIRGNNKQGVHKVQNLTLTQIIEFWACTYDQMRWFKMHNWKINILSKVWVWKVVGLTQKSSVPTNLYRVLLIFKGITIYTNSKKLSSPTHPYQNGSQLSIFDVICVHCTFVFLPCRLKKYPLERVSSK